MIKSHKKIKNIVKKLFIVFLVFIILLFLVFLCNKDKNENIGKIYAASNANSTSDLQLLARAINGEARGEPYEGQVAVGAVILNRVKSSKFPNTIAGVIYEKRSIYCGI